MRRTRSLMFMRQKEYRLGSFKEEAIYGCIFQYRLDCTVVSTKGWFFLHVHYRTSGPPGASWQGSLYVEHCWCSDRGKRAWWSRSWPWKHLLEVYPFCSKQVPWPSKEVVSPRKRQQVFVNGNKVYCSLFFSSQIFGSISFWLRKYTLFRPFSWEAKQMSH